MDPRTLGLLIPILALLTGLIVVLKMPRRAFLKDPEPDTGNDERIQMLEDEVSQLRQQLAATDERLRFAEQLLERPKEPVVLPRAE